MSEINWRHLMAQLARASPEDRKRIIATMTPLDLLLMLGALRGHGLIQT